MQRQQRSWLRIMIIVLVAEKIIQHTLVTLAFFFNWMDIRATVAVNPDILMVVGGIAALLFAFSLWGLFTYRGWATGLLIGLAVFDILGEFADQGTIIIKIPVSFLVAVVLLLLVLVYRRQLSKSRVRDGVISDVKR
jgi:hypothetical protein